MSDAFAEAAAEIGADPDLSLPALWRIGGDGPPVPIRIILESKDDMAGRGRADTLSASVSRLGLFGIFARGDTLEFTDLSGTHLRKVDGIEKPDPWTYELRLALV